MCCRWSDVLGFVPAGSVSSSSTLTSSGMQSTCDGCFPYQSTCSVISLHVQNSVTVQKRRSLQGRMSNIDARQPGLPIPLFTFSLKRNASRSRFDPESVQPTCAIQHFDNLLAALYNKNKTKQKSKKKRRKKSAVQMLQFILEMEKMESTFHE